MIKINIPLLLKIRGFLALGIWPPKLGKVIHYDPFLDAYEIEYSGLFYKSILIASERIEKL